MNTPDPTIQKYKDNMTQNTKVSLLFESEEHLEKWLKQQLVPPTLQQQLDEASRLRDALKTLGQYLR